jgi:hypothetical protein
VLKNVFVLPRFDLCHVLSSSTNNFARAQLLSRMSSLSDCMNMWGRAAKKEMTNDNGQAKK